MDYNQYKVIPEPIKLMAEQSGHSVSRIAEVVPELTADLIRTWHTRGNDKELDKMLETAWEKIFKYAYTDQSDDITPLYLKGPAGQGKTTTFKVAAKNIADAMGVKFLLDPDMKASVEQYDIIMAVAQLGGAISPSVIQGVPNTENGYTYYNPPSRIAKMAQQQMSIFLLDDLDNTNEAVKNSAMPVVLDKRLNDVNLNETTYVGVTGNLGAIDGTNTSKDSAALLNRASVRLVADTLGDWLERGHQRFNDVYGMAMLDEFLMQHPDNFYPAKSKKDRGQRATSRSWDALTNKLRNYLAEHDAQTKAGLTPTPIIPKLETVVPSYVGPECAAQLTSFYSDMLTLARPAALQVMQNGKLADEMYEKLNVVFSERTSESEAVARGYLRQLQAMVGNELKNAISINPTSTTEQQEISKRILKAINKFSCGCFTAGLVKNNKVNLIAQYTHALLASVVDYSEKNHTYVELGRKTDKGDYIPSQLLGKLLAEAGNKFNSDHVHGEALINVSGDKNNTVTALQAGFIDPMTITSQMASLEQEAKQVSASMS